MLQKEDFYKRKQYTEKKFRQDLFVVLIQLCGIFEFEMHFDLCSICYFNIIVIIEKLLSREHGIVLNMLALDVYKMHVSCLFHDICLFYHLYVRKMHVLCLLIFLQEVSSVAFGFEEKLEITMQICCVVFQLVRINSEISQLKAKN
jgi:hypothetical protein